MDACLPEITPCNEGCDEETKAQCIIFADGTTLEDWKAAIDAAIENGGGTIDPPGCKVQFPIISTNWETPDICNTETFLSYMSSGGVADGYVYYVFDRLLGQAAALTVVDVIQVSTPITTFDISQLALGSYTMHVVAYQGTYTPQGIGTTYGQLVDTTTVHSCAALNSGQPTMFNLVDCSGGVDDCPDSGTENKNVTRTVQIKL